MQPGGKSEAWDDRKPSESEENGTLGKNYAAGAEDAPPAPAVPSFRVCLVDDMADYHELFKAHVVTVASVQLLPGFLNGRDAITQIPKLKPDLVFIDVKLGDMDGLDLLRSLHPVAPEAAGILVSALHVDEHIVWALENGASGYIAKTDGAQCFVQAITDFQNGLPYLSPTAWRALARLNTGKAQANKLKFRLSDAEWRVLELLFAGRRRKEVAETMKCAQGTVDVHCRKAFKKLGASGLEEAQAKLDWKHWERHY
jgi:two-component system, NarL family, response regulator LiaR